MSQRSKYQTLLIANGLEVMLDKLPHQSLTNPEKAQKALRRFRLRQDNEEVSAFAELMAELTACIKIDLLTEKDLVETFVQMKIHFEQ